VWQVLMEMQAEEREVALEGMTAKASSTLKPEP
jgi:hypothetical protein